MGETLPESMIARLMELGVNLLKVAEEDRDQSLEELERAVLNSVRGAMPGFLEEVVKINSNDLRLAMKGVKASCPECGKKTGVQSWRKRTVASVCGEVTIERPWYVCPDCRTGWSPVDRTLGVESRARLSAGLLDWLVRLGAGCASFSEAAGVLERLTGLDISEETIRLRTEERGQQLEGAEQSAIRVVKSTQEAAEKVDRAPGALLVETDGAMVRYLDGWHEVKLGLVGGYVDGRLVKPSYVAGRESVEEFGPRLLAEAARRGALEVVSWKGAVNSPGLAVLREVTLLGDGAVWIWNMGAEHLGQRVEIVDFFHGSEHLWTVAKALHGEGTAGAEEWAKEHVELLLKEGARPVIQAIAPERAPNEETEAIRKREENYFRTNAARMDYPTFRKMGLPIGSGAIESSAKHLVQDRLKRPGARWSPEGAQAILDIRCRISSNRSLAA